MRTIASSEMLGGHADQNAISHPLAAQRSPVFFTTSLSSVDGGPQNAEGPTDEIPGAPSPSGPAVPLAMGSSFDAVINTGGDRDAFAVNLVAGQSYVFTLTGSGATPLDDPFLEIFAPDGATLLAIDDDGGPGRNSQLRFTAQTTGTYFVNAMAWDSYDPADGPPVLTGGYTITANVGPAQNPLDTIDLGFALPAATPITVYFATGGETFNGVTATRSWTPGEITAAMQAMATFSAITPLVFTQVGVSAGATFIMSLAELEPGTLGQFSSSAIGTVGQGGFGVFDPTNEFWSPTEVQPGGKGFVTLIHEVGHGLGLAHPHDNGGINPNDSSEIMQGVLEPFDSVGTFGMNVGYATIMSYNTTNELTPGTLDIALLQQKYGANTTANSGDNIYALPTVEFTAQPVKVIWDTGGTDTISYSGLRAALIDLRPATLLTERGGAGFPSTLVGFPSGFVIANGVVIENATGSSGGDTLTGNQVANILTGNDGDDILQGFAGADTLLGGVGVDTAVYSDDIAGVTVNLLTQTAIDGWGATDTLSAIENVTGSAFNDTITGGAGGVFGASILRGGAGNDIIVDNSTTEGTVNGDDGNDTLTGSAARSIMNGGNGNDTVFGGDGNDSLFGAAGNDILDGGTGIDRMEGGNGNDTYTVDNTSDFVVEDTSDGIDRVQASISYALGVNIEELALLGSANLNGTGNALANLLLGNSGANTLLGGDGADQLYGGAGNDRLEGGAGADFMRGGVGDDTFIVDNAGDVLSEDASQGFDRVETSISYAISANIEHLTLLGSAAINGTGNAQANTILGNSGNNILSGGDGADSLYGGLGSDRIDGGLGADFLRGGVGDDTFVVDNAGDVVSEDAGQGYDRVEVTAAWTMTETSIESVQLVGGGFAVTGNSQANLILGNELANTLIGGAGDDQLYAGSGTDRIDGGIGADFMRGGLGNDTYVVDNISDVISEDANADIDRVETSISYTLGVNLEQLQLLGSANIDGGGNSANNLLLGNSGNNVLLGAGGLDQLYGGAGDDLLVGGDGNDFLQGGAGSDAFLFSASLGTAGIDTISDFNVAQDVFWLDDTVFTGINAGVLNADAFAIGSSAADAADRIIYDPTTGALYYDADGSGAGASVQIATLSTNLALTAANILGI